MRLANVAQGETATLALVVLSATARETRNKKPYLQLEFFDGFDKISGNYWDWSGVNVPEKNAILDVTAQLTEYMGKPQLNIKRMVANTTKHISEFTPSNGIDIGKTFMDAHALLLTVEDDFLRELGIRILEDLKKLWITAPGAATVHHAYTAGTLIHSLCVARTAQAIAKVTEGAFTDLVVVGAFLHDVGKLFAYRIDGIVCEMTDEGRLYEHTFLGARFVSNFAEDLIKDDRDEAKLELLCHIILSHHGKQEYGAAIPPQSLEAHIVHYADALDASAEQVRAASNKVGKTKWTEKIWALNNKQHITTQYTRAVFGSAE